MRQLVTKGRFPLFSFVRVDPDVIQRYLPEYSLYLHSSPEDAGRLTNKEAGYIAEIGLEAGKNVMVDGSLRNADWYKEYFGKLPHDFPKLKLAIIHITDHSSTGQRQCASCQSIKIQKSYLSRCHFAQLLHCGRRFVSC